MPKIENAYKCLKGRKVKKSKRSTDYSYIPRLLDP